MGCGWLCRTRPLRCVEAERIETVVHQTCEGVSLESN